MSRQGAREDERLRSPEFQRDLIGRKAAADGLAVTYYEPEIDVSGSKPKRAVLDAIVEKVERGELAGIIVAKLDRLSRLAPRDRLELFERIEGVGGVVLSASENLDATTPEGRFAREVFLGVARMQWEKYAEGFEVAKVAAVERGVKISNRAPFGYRFDAKHRLEVVAEERDLVVELFERRATGASYGELLELFEASTGRRSYRETIKHMLENRSYVGDVVYAELVKEDAHEAIVGRDLFEAVQRMNEERSSYGVRQRTRAVALLAGIVTCAGCGRKLVRSTGGAGRRAIYKCPNDTRHCGARASVLESSLDELVEAAVLEWAGPLRDELLELETELDATGDRIVAEHRFAEAERVALEYEANVELELEIGGEAYAAGRQARAKLVELRRAELEACGEASELELVRTTLRQAWPELDVDEKRRLLAIAVERLVVRRRKSPSEPVVDRVELELADGGVPSEAEREDGEELGPEAGARVVVA